MSNVYYTVAHKFLLLGIFIQPAWATEIQTSRKRPHKMSSVLGRLIKGGGRLRELRPYWIKIFPHQSTITADNCFIHGESRFQKKIRFFPFRNFRFLYQPDIHSQLHYLSTGRLREIKNKGKFQTLSYKSGRGRLREVIASIRF